MPDTGERGEIRNRANAKEAQTAKESKDLVSKTKEQFSDKNSTHSPGGPEHTNAHEGSKE